MRCTYGLTAEMIAERAGVDVSTARRWKAGTSRVPRAAAMILEADLGAFSRRARGWRIDGEELVSPEGWRISLNEVLAVPLMKQQIAHYQAELRGLSEPVDNIAIEEQPLPEAEENEARRLR